MDRDSMKRAAARAAVAEVLGDIAVERVIGVGTGSTIACFIDALREHGAQSRIDLAVPSSDETALRLAAAGIAVGSLDEALDRAARIPIYVDGADEIDRGLRMIKGGGGALTREKIVASASRRFVCIADEEKRVARLGQRDEAGAGGPAPGRALPLEVIPMAARLVEREIASRGGRAVARGGFVTDNGNAILDVHGLRLPDSTGELIELELRLGAIPGVVECGLFARRRADLLLLGTARGVERHGPA